MSGAAYAPPSPMRLLPLLLFLTLPAQAFTHQDSLRGSNGPGRAWWNILRYDLRFSLNTAHRTISGTNRIQFRIIAPVREAMQIDLQRGMDIREARWDGRPVPFRRDSNVYWLTPPRDAVQKGIHEVQIVYGGRPRVAVNPPWDGGLIWTHDSSGKPWLAVACQGLGASAWWPCKDYQGDEPDSGMTIQITNPTGQVVVSNGRFSIPVDTLQQDGPGGLHTVMLSPIGDQWSVRNPINNYDVTYYIGDYVHWHDTLRGEKGVLDLDFYPLRYNERKARKQWTQVKEMLRCFEYWLGPYPFYEDGYKLVEAPYLGMEHQSAIAYGNGYKNGYRRPHGQMIDRSGTGVGFAFDFIIIHESGHEWFGNSITARDIADSWLHEGFTTYTEALFAEWVRGRDSGIAYAQGEWKNIRNDRLIIGHYGVQDEGSSDRYDKGAAVVHMIRMMLQDDEKFRQLLRGLNHEFYHRTVSSSEVETYISRFVGKDLKPFFDVYLRSTIKPVLEWKATLDSDSRQWKFSYAWKGTPPGFEAPFSVEKMLLKNGQDSYQQPFRIHAQGWYDIREIQP